MRKMMTNKNVEVILSKKNYKFDDLCLIMEILRGEGGCPWDTEQTHESIRKNLIEETYEVIEAIDTKNTALLREELGDVMLQVVFHTQMEKEIGSFDIDDVANDVCVKLIHRHPHIFGDVKVDTAAEVLSNWEEIKNIEGTADTVIFDGVISQRLVDVASEKGIKKLVAFKSMNIVKKPHNVKLITID